MNRILRVLRRPISAQKTYALQQGRALGHQAISVLISYFVFSAYLFVHAISHVHMFHTFSQLCTQVFAEDLLLSFGPSDFGFSFQ